jgi:pyruvate/2-oxoglutarate dehydrogenase complex dihydrolipoamide dehydrogenase (E3) component
LTSSYDLIVIGDTSAARQAAAIAAATPARVAWIIPPAIDDSAAHPHGDWFSPALARMAEIAEAAAAVYQGEIDSEKYWRGAVAAIDRLSLQSAPAFLAVAGVDTIAGMPEFFRLPHLGLRVDKRTLRARSYLVATGSLAPNVTMAGLEETGYVSTETLPLVADREKIPHSWAIVGTESNGAVLAQTLARLGHEVILIIEGDRLLPYEEAHVAYQVQMVLEAAGVKIYFNRQITAVRAATGKKLIFMGDETIAVDEIFAALPDTPWIESFNLAGVGVDYDDRGIVVNEFMQTTNAKIYACGSVCGSFVGGYRGQRSIESEARVAVHNALWWRRKILDRADIPYSIDIEPPIARVGLTAGELTNRPDVTVLNQKYTNNEYLSIVGAIGGWCQICVSRDGEILGATIWGDRSPELIELIALAMGEGIPIDRLAGMEGMSPTHAEVLYQTARQWLERNPRPLWQQRFILWWLRRF